MSKISEFTDRVITLVAEETDTPKEAILSKSRTAEAVDVAHVAKLYCVGKVELSLLDCVFVYFRGIIAVYLDAKFA